MNFRGASATRRRLLPFLAGIFDHPFVMRVQASSLSDDVTEFVSVNESAGGRYLFLDLLKVPRVHGKELYKIRVLHLTVPPLSHPG